MRKRSDDELIQEALARVAHIEEATGKAEALGISEATVRRWEKDPTGPMRDTTRQPVLRFLGGENDEVTTGGATAKVRDAIKLLTDALHEMAVARATSGASGGPPGGEQDHPPEHDPGEDEEKTGVA